MQVRRALTFMFTDPAWPSNLGLAVLVDLPASLLTIMGWSELRSLVPLPLQGAVSSPLWWLVIVGLARVPFSGYELRLLRQVIAGQDAPLPVWSDGGDLVRDGVCYWVVTSIWLLPGDIYYRVSDATRQMPRALLALVFVMTLLVVVTWVAAPAAQARLAARGSVEAGLDVRRVLGVVRRNLRGYTLLAVVTLVGGAVIMGSGFLVTRLLASFASMPIPNAGNALTLLFRLYGSFVLAHLAGQVYVGAHCR